MNKEQAEILVKQLGGNQLVAMTGAKGFGLTTDGKLAFRIQRAKNGINLITVTLNNLDLYDVKFEKFRFSAKTGTTRKVIEEHNNVYSDMLRGIFERATGLRTSLTHVYA